MEKIKLIENSSELGAGTRGASLGPDAMKIASIKANSKYFTNYPIEILPDNNDLLFHDIQYDKAKRTDGVVENYELISSTVKRTFENGEFPIVV